MESAMAVSLLLLEMEELLEVVQKSFQELSSHVGCLLHAL
jgi:hypothetical protein